MADEDDWDSDVGDIVVNPLDASEKHLLPPPDVNPTAYSKYPLQRLVQAAYDGDLELLEKMLDREDPVNGYHHDINTHSEDVNALHAAAMNGQLEAVEMLLSAGADPHIKQSMPYGREPKDGETAREMADKFGWDDIVIALKKAEEKVQKGVYLRYGVGNNAKLWPIDRPEGLDPEQEKRAKRKHKGLVRTLPSRDERKFYGDLVYGLTHGWDENGNVIKRPQAFASGPIRSSPSQGGADAEEGRGAREPVALTAGQAVTRIGLLFPGQGSQYVKMLSKMPQSDKVREMLALAEKVLGYDILRICSEGPEETLERTEYAQPAIYVASLVAMEQLRESRPEAVSSPGAIAGLSLGEYTALTVAGVFSFETGLRLVKERAEAMAEAGKGPPQAMLSVAGLGKDKLKRLCEEAEERTGGLCRIANELFAKGYTCSGAAAAVEVLQQLADEAGALQTKAIRTSGAFHTPFMEPAKERLEAALRAALPEMRRPRCDVYMNVTGKVVRVGTEPAEIIPLLCGQLTSPVLWESCVKSMIAAGIEEFCEVGPMKQLKAMMKRIDQDMWSRTQNIEV